MAKLKAISNEKNIFRDFSFLFFILGIVVMPLIFIPLVLDPALTSKYLFTALLLFASLISLFLNKAKIQPQLGKGQIIMIIAFVLFLFFSFISTLLAQNFSEAISEFSKYILFFLCFTIISVLISENKNIQNHVVKLVVLQNLIISAGGWIQFLVIASQIQLSHLETYQVSFTFAHRNLFSMMIFMGLSFQLIAVTRYDGLWKKLALTGLLLSLSLITVLLTKSVWVALLISSILTILLFLNYSYRFNEFKVLGKKLLAGIILVAGIFVFAGYLYSIFDSSETLEKQTGFLTNYRYGSALERVDLWEKTAELYRDKPLLGVGPGNWKIAMPALGVDGLRSEKGEIYFVRAHNDFLQSLSETGIFAFIFYIFIFLFPIFLIIRTLRSSESNDKKIEGLFLFFGLLGFIIFSFLDFPRERMEHNFMLALLLGFITVNYEKVESQKFVSKSGSYFLYFVFILISVLTIIIGVFRFSGEVFLKTGLQARENADWDLVIRSMDKAENVFNKIDNTSTPLAWYRGSAWFNKGEKEKAFEDFQEAYRQNPNHLHVVNNLGTSYEVSGNHNKSEEMYRRALSISKSFDEARLNLCIVYFNQGKVDLALNELVQIKPENQNENYKAAVYAISCKRMENVFQQLEENILKKSLQRIYNSQDWTLKVFGNAIVDEMSFDKRVIVEIIYLNEVLDKTISKMEADSFREKYLGIKPQTKI